jgi:hypothetical protein
MVAPTLVCAGSYPKGNGSVNLNYRDKKINLFSNVGLVWRLSKYLKPLPHTKDTLYDQTSVNITSSKSVNVKAGADYFVNSKNTIGIMATDQF